MSNPAELLALLSIHGINLNHVPGGIPSLVALDVAGGLGMIHDHAAAAMLLAKYSMDAHATRTYRDHWRMMVDRRAYTEGWKDDGRLVAFANYSFEEWMDAQRCRTCNGGGNNMTETGPKDCQACEGTGLRRIGLRAPARGLGMSTEAYRKSAWPNRMEWARKELQQRELAALSALAWRMRK
jgi:hypothetical protein